MPTTSLLPKAAPLRVVLIEDNDLDAELIIAYLQLAGYAPQVQRVTTGPAFSAALSAGPWDLVLSDYTLPQFNVPAALRLLRASGQDLPFIIISGTIGEEQAATALRAGAHDFVIKDRLTRLAPAITRELREAEERARRRLALAETDVREARTRALLAHTVDAITLLSPDGRVLYASPSTQHMLGYPNDALLNADLAAYVHPADRPALAGMIQDLLAQPARATTAEYRVLRQDGAWRWLHASARNQLADPAVAGLLFNFRDVTERVLAVDALAASEAALEVWATALDLRGHEPPGHTQRVTRLALRLAIALGLPEDELINLRRGALLHDLGHLGVPEQILLKPGPLDPAEWAAVQQHPTIANDLLAPIESLRQAAAIPYSHHEKWNGTGYPQGLQAEAIPLPARLFAVVDVYEALQSPRPYRPAWPQPQALEYIQSNVSTHFDPQIVKTFLPLIQP